MYLHELQEMFWWDASAASEVCHEVKIVNFKNSFPNP